MVTFVRAPVRSVSYDCGEQFSAIGTVIVVKAASNESNSRHRNAHRSIEREIKSEAK